MISEDLDNRILKTVGREGHMALSKGRTINIGAPNPEGWGPWVGVPAERQAVCAFKGCTQRGAPRICPYDGRYHHHGCIHYDLKDKRMRDGWCWVCTAHYAVLVAEKEKARAT